MVPSDYKDFLVAVVTSSATFIGLLFVAMTLITDKRSKSRKQVVTEKIMAEASYIALLNLFFVSIVALLPDTQLSYIMIIMGVIGLNNSLRLFRSGLRDGVSGGILGISTLIYAVQLVYGIYLLTHSSQSINETIFLIVIFTLFGSGLGRAWELTGIHNQG